MSTTSTTQESQRSAPNLREAIDGALGSALEFAHKVFETRELGALGDDFEASPFFVDSWRATIGKTRGGIRVPRVTNEANILQGDGLGGGTHRLAIFDFKYDVEKIGSPEPRRDAGGRICILGVGVQLFGEDYVQSDPAPPRRHMELETLEGHPPFGITQTIIRPDEQPYIRRLEYTERWKSPLPPPRDKKGQEFIINELLAMAHYLDQGAFALGSLASQAHVRPGSQLPPPAQP